MRSADAVRRLSSWGKHHHTNCNCPGRRRIRNRPRIEPPPREELVDGLTTALGVLPLALSFNCPFLYFLYSTKTEQPVYRCFKEQSEKLKELFLQDLKRHSGKVSVDFVKASTEPFKSVGFIVELIKQVKSRYDTSGRNPAEIQVEVQSLQFKSLTLAEGRAALADVFKSDIYFFPIIFDECAIQPLYRSANRGDVDERMSARLFTFMRSIVRCLLCMPVFMGTNAQAANFLGVSQIMEEIGSGSYDLCCWCILWHRPPGVPNDVMTETFGMIRKVVSDWRGQNSFPSDSLLNFLEKYLAFERPLFLVYAVQYIKFFCENEESYCNSDEEFMSLLFEDIMEEFIYRKSLVELINCGQVAYMSAYTWDRGIRDTPRNAGENLVKTSIPTDLYINSHLGYLSARPDNVRFPKYATIATKIKKKKYERVYLKDHLQDFAITTSFEPFNEAPLTGLIVTGITADNQRVLCEKEDSEDVRSERKGNNYANSDVRKRNTSSLKRISLIHSIVKNIAPTKSTASEYSPKTSGFRLELSLFVAAILASRGGGFKGCRFDVFLEHLAREFQYEGIYGDKVKPPSILFHKDFPQSVKEKQIPFLASMALSKWETTLAEDLQERFDAYLGTAVASVGNASGDVVITDYPNDSIILVGECKMFTAPVNAGYLKKEVVLKKFSKYPGCDLFLVAAVHFSSLPSFQHPDMCLWILERDTSDNLHLIPAKTEVPQNTNVAKHIIILDMHVLSGLPLKSRELEKMIKRFRTK